MIEKEFIICRGIQGSGKSTFAKDWTNEKPEERVRFNNDELRKMCGPYWIPSREPLIKYMKEKFIFKSMELGYNIVIDNMNLSEKEINSLKDLVESFNLSSKLGKDSVKYNITYKDFFIPLTECIYRDNLREGDNKIGFDVICKTYERYQEQYGWTPINEIPLPGDSVEYKGKLYRVIDICGPTDYTIIDINETAEIRVSSEEIKKLCL